MRRERRREVTERVFAVDVWERPMRKCGKENSIELAGNIIERKNEYADNRTLKMMEKFQAGKYAVRLNKSISDDT